MPYEDQCGRTCGFLNIEEDENTGVFKRRYFQLDSRYNKLHYFKDNPINLNRHARNPVWEIELHKVSKVSDARKLRPKVEFCFVVNFAGRRFFLQAEDQADMNKWIDVLNNASKIIVPKSEVYNQETMEWHYGDLSQGSYRTQVAGGVVCKIAQVTSADEMSNSTDSDDNDMGRGIPACHLAAHKSGYAVKQGAVRKNWKRRFFVLTDQGISYYHSEHSLSPIRTIPKSNLLEVKVSQGIHPDRDNLFEVLTSKRIFYVQADSPTDMSSWIEAVRKLLRTVKSEERKKSWERMSMQDGGNKNLNYEVELVYPKGQWFQTFKACWCREDKRKQPEPPIPPPPPSSSQTNEHKSSIDSTGGADLHLKERPKEKMPTKSAKKSGYFGSHWLYISFNYLSRM